MRFNSETMLASTFTRVFAVTGKPPSGSLRHGVHSFNNRLCVFLRHPRFCTVQYQRKS